MKKKYDVCFVGGYHPYRAYCIRKIREAGINVHVFGNGWESGPLEVDSMVKVFNQSKINLNLSNNESFDFRFVFGFKRPILESLKVAKKTLLTLIKKDSKTIEMVKARHFEINSCLGTSMSNELLRSSSVFFIPEIFRSNCSVLFILVPVNVNSCKCFSAESKGRSVCKF